MMGFIFADSGSHYLKDTQFKNRMVGNLWQGRECSRVKHGLLQSGKEPISTIM